MSTWSIVEYAGGHPDNVVQDQRPRTVLAHSTVYPNASTNGQNPRAAYLCLEHWQWCRHVSQPMGSGLLFDQGTTIHSLFSIAQFCRRLCTV